MPSNPTAQGATAGTLAVFKMLRPEMSISSEVINLDRTRRVVADRNARLSAVPACGYRCIRANSIVNSLDDALEAWVDAGGGYYLRETEPGHAEMVKFAYRETGDVVVGNDNGIRYGDDIRMTLCPPPRSHAVGAQGNTGTRGTIRPGRPQTPAHVAKRLESRAATYLRRSNAARDVAREGVAA